MSWFPEVTLDGLLSVSPVKGASRMWRGLGLCGTEAGLVSVPRPLGVWKDLLFQEKHPEGCLVLGVGYVSPTSEAQVWLQTREAFYFTAPALACILKCPD